VILVVLALQGIAAAGLTPGPVEESPFLWPFLDYPMYTQPHYEGDGVPRYRVTGITGDGREVEITPETLGTDYWIYQDAFLYSFMYRPQRDELEPGVRMYEGRHGVSLVEVRLENRPLVVTREGTVDGAPELEGTARRTRPDGPWAWEVP
jgi:hypothetical protein